VKLLMGSNRTSYPSRGLLSFKIKERGEGREWEGSGRGEMSTSSAVMVSPMWPGAGLGLNGQQTSIRLQGQIVHVVD